jgi:hypothetical protein
MKHARTHADMSALIREAHPNIGGNAVHTLASYAEHVRDGKTFSEAENTAVFNAIRMWACVGLYGHTMDTEDEEWFMCHDIMRRFGLDIERTEHI